MLSKPRYFLIIPFIITLPMTIHAELLGLNYSECIVKNLQNVESEIAAINVVSACFDEFCAKRRFKNILIPTEYGYQSNNEGHNTINSSSQQPCNNYRDNQKEIQVTIPRQSRGLSFMSRSKRLKGVANAAPAIKNHLKVV